MMINKDLVMTFMFLVGVSAHLPEPPGNPTLPCVRYIIEGEYGSCNCEARFHEDKPSDFSLTWPGHSDTPSLQLTNVSREDNGTVFTCLMIWNGHRRTANYTLQVVYGPDDAHTTIVGPSTFIADGTKPLTLTCKATETNPSPIYMWNTNRCDIEDPVAGTCTFTPEPLLDDGQRIQCITISNAGTSNKGTAELLINLSYPPKDPPFISGYAPGGVISHGSQLRCSVSGGKPAVSMVVFTCQSLQNVSSSSQTTQSEDGNVSNFLIIHDANSEENISIQCTCRGVWAPQEDLYTMTTSMQFLIHNEDVHGRIERTHPELLVVAVLLFLLALLLIFVVVFFKRKFATRPEESKQECIPDA